MIGFNLSLILWLACSVHSDNLPFAQGDGVQVLEETTQVQLGGVAVGIGNVWDREYSLPDGSKRRGTTAKLFFPDHQEIVGEGSVFLSGSLQWRVAAVENLQGHRGRVLVEPVE